MTHTGVPLVRRDILHGRVQVLSRSSYGNGKFSPQIEDMVREVGIHCEKLGAPQVAEHAKKVLKAALEGHILDIDPVRMAKQMLIHSFDSESHLPNIGLDEADLRIHAIQNRLKALDALFCEGAAGHIKLLNDRSIDPTDLFFAISTRIADAMTVHDVETSDAATTRIPGVFPIHSDWSKVKVAFAGSMLKIYMHYADSGGQTDAYRCMRDVAMDYLHPKEFAEVAKILRRTEDAVVRTDLVVLGILSDMSERLGLKVLVARDNKTAAKAFGKIGPDTVVVIIRGDKGPGGALNKHLKKGIPPERIHDRKAFKVIADTEELAYKITAFLYEQSIRRIASARGSRDVYIHYPTDYIANPKPITGYQGLHLDIVVSDGNLVSCEGIICTLRQYLWADMGGASHAGYKDSSLCNGELERFEQTREAIVAREKAPDRSVRLAA